MAVAGIISEYNPFHRGHMELIRLTRASIGGGAGIICVMSGNFVQRGDFAIFEKHARAHAAVRYGADLVLEIPVPYVLSSAEKFALGSAALLDALGVVTHLAFGSESGNAEPLYAAAECLQDGSISNDIKAALSTGVSFAAARYTAARSAIGEAADILKTPNNILGVEYIKALRTLGSDITPLTFARKGAAHDGTASEGTASASHIRGMLRGQEDPWGFVPAAAAEIFIAEIAEGRAPVYMDSCETAVLAKLRTMTKEEFGALPDASEGLGNRLARYSWACGSVAEVLEGTKTKRYAMSRIRRMLLCAYLGIKAGDTRTLPSYAKVLALNENGRKLLRQIARVSDIRLITKPAEAKKLEGDALGAAKLEAAATDLYALAYPGRQNRTGGGEWTKGPIIV